MRNRPVRGRSWRLRKRPKVIWGRHSRPIFAKYRSAAGSPRPLWPPRSRRRMGMRRPSAFTQADVKRAIRGAMAAGVTPGRIVVTRDGFAIEIGQGTATNGDAAAATPGDDVNLWDEILGVQEPPR
jgi:hypothetical protein